VFEGYNNTFYSFYTAVWKALNANLGNLDNFVSSSVL